MCTVDVILLDVNNVGQGPSVVRLVVFHRTLVSLLINLFRLQPSPSFPPDDPAPITDNHAPVADDPAPITDNHAPVTDDPAPAAKQEFPPLPMRVASANSTNRKWALGSIRSQLGGW